MTFLSNGLAAKTILMTSALCVLALLSGCAEDAAVEQTPEETAALLARIKPAVTLDEILGKTAPVESKAADAPAAEGSATATEKTVAVTSGADMAGKKLYDGACMACHSTGAAGAPKLGDKAAWESRAAAGFDAMLSSAIKGKGVMPPNGGSAYSEAEMRQVIEYMLAEAGL